MLSLYVQCGCVYTYNVKNIIDSILQKCQEEKKNTDEMIMSWIILEKL